MKDEKTGDDLVSIGFVIDLDYADATTSAHDLLQQFKTHPLVRKILEGGERVSLGRQGASRPAATGRCPSCRCRAPCWSATPPAWSTWPRSRACTTRSSRASSPPSTIYRSLKAGSTDFSAYEDAVEESLIGKELYEQRNTRQPFQMGLIRGGPLVNLMIATKGRFPGGRWKIHRNDAKPMFIGKTQEGLSRSRTASTSSTSSRASSSSGNATRDDAPNHIRVQQNVPREIAETWQWMCPAGVYEIPEDAPEKGDVDVIVNYTNCVQCGAITAKGGRLTTPEGGDGPLYRNT